MFCWPECLQMWERSCNVPVTFTTYRVATKVLAVCVDQVTFVKRSADVLVVLCLLEHEQNVCVSLHIYSAGYNEREVMMASVSYPQRQKRSSKSWQKRLEGRSRRPLVEEDLRRLFALRMRFSRRTKLEADLTGLFNERKIPHYVDPEVNLRDLFSIKPPQKVKG